MWRRENQETALSQHMTRAPVTGRSRLGRIRARVVAAAGLAAALALVHPDIAAAHTGDDAQFGHIVVEFALWGIGLAAFIGLLVSVLWVRARLRRHGE